MSVLQDVFKQVKHWEYGAEVLMHDMSTSDIDRAREEGARRALRNVAMLLADKMAIYSDPPALEILKRVELLRACNLHNSEKHPNHDQRERSAGAADCCARLLATFSEESEVDDAVEIG